MIAPALTSIRVNWLKPLDTIHAGRRLDMLSDGGGPYRAKPSRHALAEPKTRPFLKAPSRLAHMLILGPLLDPLEHVKPPLA